MPNHGETLTPEESVAIMLAVAEHLGWHEPPRTLESIVLSEDGTVDVACVADGVPGLPVQYAELLQRLLAQGRTDAPTRAPGALLLLIARARGDIDLPPFGTPQQFGHALQRFLSKPVSQVIASAVARVHPADAEPTPAARTAERRVNGPRVDDLRRWLREADLDRITLEHRLAAAVRAGSVVGRVPERRATGPRADELRRMLREADLERIAMAERLRQHEFDVYAQPPAPGSSPDVWSHQSAPGRRVPGRPVAVVGLLTVSFIGGALFWGPRGIPSMPSAAPRAVTGAASSSLPDKPRADERRILDADGASREAGAPAAATSAPSTARARAVDAPGFTSPAVRTPPVPPSAPPQASDTSDASETPAMSPGDAPSSSSAPRRTLQPLQVPAPTAYSPSFGPDGGTVYFHAQSREGSRLMRADIETNGWIRDVATLVDDGARNFHVRLSPDGSRVAFDSDRDGIRAVYVATHDGAQVRRVSGEGYAAVPVWSPDGRQLLYLRGEDRAPRTWNLWRLSLDTGEQQRLTSHRYGQAWPGSWFADASRICYTHEDRIHVLNLDTGRSRSIASPVRGRLVRTAAVSPNGTFVAYQVHRDGMWLLDLRDGSSRRVLDDPTAEEFTWSPDGRRIAFHSRRDGRWGVWMMAAPLSP